MQRRTVGELTRKEWLLGPATALAGAINGAGLMVLATPELLGINSFWEFYVLTCLLGGLAFPVLTVALTNRVADATIAVTRRSDGLAGFLAQLVGEFGLASVTTPLGIGWAFVLWLVFGVVVIPHVLIAVGRGGPLAFPHLGLDLVVGYLVYGLSQGGFYGLLVQEHDVRARIVAAIRPGPGRRRARR